MNYKPIALFILTIFSVSVLGLAENVNASTGKLIVEARSQNNDGDGGVLIYSTGSHNSYTIKKGETLTIDLPSETKIITFVSKAGPATIYSVDKFLQAPVNHVIDVHVNFYTNYLYDNIFWIEGGWYYSSKNIYHPTWGSGSSVCELEWNVAANHWNEYHDKKI